MSRRNGHILHDTATYGAALVSDKCKSKRRAEENCGSDPRRSRQKVGRTTGTKKAARSAGPEGCPHVSSLTMLEQDKTNDRQRGQHLDDDDKCK